MWPEKVWEPSGVHPVTGQQTWHSRVATSDDHKRRREWEFDYTMRELAREQKEYVPNELRQRNTGKQTTHKRGR